MRRSSLLARWMMRSVGMAGASLLLSAQNPKTAGEAFKNIQVLKRVPADQWFDTMAFIAGSLGVTCDHCHSAEFEADEGNPNKLKAREMMRMVDGINAGRFAGRVVVTCNTCHRGDSKPRANPVPDAEHWMQAAGSPLSPPAAEEILNRYRRSIAGIKTQSISMHVETYGGNGPARRKSVEMLLDAGGVRIVEHDDKIQKTMMRSGQNAWIDLGKGWRAMREGETFDAFEVAEVFAPDQVRKVEPSGPVSIDRSYGSVTYVLPVSDKNGRKWLFFDPDTGVLVRRREFFTSFYGDGSIDVNYKNYRKFGETFLPMKIEVINAGGAGLIVRSVVSRRVNVRISQTVFKPGEQLIERR